MKKIKFSVLSVVLFVSMFITSCSNNDSPKDTNGTSTGNYWPMAKNNQWNFELDGSSSYSMSITGTDVFGGVTYYKVNDESLHFDAEIWMTKKGATYFNKVGDYTFSDSGVNVTMKGYEIPVLKDNLDVNGTWTGTVTSKATYSYSGKTGSYNVIIKYTGTILEKGTSVAVNDLTYDNIIKSSLTQEITANGQTTTATSIMWYAKDIGPVKETAIEGGETKEHALNSYSLH